MQLNLSSKVIECLKQNQGQKFTARAIAEWILLHYPALCAAKRARSQATIALLKDDNALIQQIVAEIGARRQPMQKQDSQLKTTEERPRKYYYTMQTDLAEVEAAESAPTHTSAAERDAVRYTEHQLYPMLASFLWAEYGIYSKRIDEKRSSNSQGANGNKWLYPDLVAMEDLTADWDQKIKDCVKQHADKKTKLWSFEVKLLINRANVRQAFFQAVSNSSWANCGYLVALELEGSDTKRELQILARLHGIGFILLNAATPSESQVLIPTQEHTEVDWDAANRLAKENHDFKSFIDEVTSFYQTGRTKRSDWDVLSD